MTPLEITPQITSLADIPAEFWIAMCIQIFILVFGIWAVTKLIGVVPKIFNRNTKPRLPNVTNPTADFDRKLKTSCLRWGVTTALLAIFLPASFHPLKLACLISSPTFFVCAVLAKRRLTAAKSAPAADANSTSSIDDDFADIAEEMRKERNTNA